MKKYINTIFQIGFLLIAGIAVGQNVYVCDNGGFEQNTVGYSFDSRDSNSTNGYLNSMLCNMNITDFASINVSSNNFMVAYASLVDNDNSIINGFEPILYSSTPAVYIPRVNEEDMAIRLNDTMFQSVTRMNKIFEVNSNTVTYSYLFIAHSILGGEEKQAHFTATVYDENDDIISQNCIWADETNTNLFSSTLYAQSGFTPPDSDDILLYTGWRSTALSLEGTNIGDIVRLEFVVTDPVDIHKFGIVYIDNICECSNCPTLNTDVGTNQVDLMQAVTCINAYNIIQSDATGAIYHAGEEVVLHNGFEALYGSTDHFYIEGCTDEYAYRQAATDNQGKDVQKPSNTISNTANGVQEFKVYPNPAQNVITIETVQDVAITKASLYSIDGKLILQTVPNDNTETNTIDISSVSKGIYVLSVETNDGRVTSAKVVKN